VIKSTPLEVNGVLYFTAPDNVWAVDARFGREIWHYQRPSEGDHIGHRGLGMYKNWLYFTTPDAHLVCLDAKDGAVRWIVELADPKLGYFSTMAPLVIRDHVIAGVSGDVTDIRGFLESLDPETGKIQWRWYTTPDPGQPGSETWPKDSDAILHGGGMTWMTGSYDPALNLLYWGTGNPNPVLAGAGRPGDNLYTCSIVALNPDTGKLAWYFQPSPHDVHDWDAVQTPVLFDADFHGQPRKLLAQASRNGFFFLLDRSTGQHLLTAPFIDQTWASGVDSAGRPIAKPEATPSPDGALVEPGSDGASNWMAPSFDPQTGLFYVNARRLFSIFYNTVTGKAEGWGGRDRNLWANSTLRALDYRTGKVAWNHEIGNGESVAGILTTAGHLLFSADNSGNLLALDPATGKTVWHLNVGGRMVASPMTYQLDGRQYLIMAVQDTLYAFALPDHAVAGPAASVSSAQSPFHN
jgi:alcohol dehydrogenase (cytochrome c)